ncbi:MAG: cache domain-containing protein [Cyanobacteria bacterium]|nr:cache domain-containing protein [Cyanobacteriota bacterium]MDA0867306.1 cache domain-containing protein [Cyanobacteriota bacterium]
MNILRKSLLTQLVSAFSALSLVTISLVSYSAYTRARESLQTEVFARLNVAVSLKEFELNQWFESQRREAVFLARSPVVINAVSAMLPPIQKAPAEGEAGPNIAAQINALTAYFSDVLDIKTHIQGIDILRNGIVIFSTDASQIGIYKGLGNPTTYFEPNQANAIPNIYISPITQQPTITFATPILDQNTERKAVLAITLSLDAIDQLIRQRAGLGATGETYLVQRINNRSVFLSGNRSETTPTVPVPDASIPDPDISSPSTAASSPTAAGASTPNEVLPSTPDTPATSPPLADAADTLELAPSASSEGIDAAMIGINRESLYKNYEGEPVIGVYKWLNGNNVALFAELSQKEAFRPAEQLAWQIFAIGLGAAGILVAVVYLIARQIVRPVLVITDTAAAIEDGEFELSVLDAVKSRPDEIGQLARIFQNMAKQVYQREQRLKRQVAELTIEIDQARKEQQVAEITETDYFKELTKKARDLRDRRNG